VASDTPKVPVLRYTRRDQEDDENMSRPTVLILASDSVFSRAITANWPQDPILYSSGPEFIVLDEGFCGALEGSNYDLAIADASSSDKKVNRQEDGRNLLRQSLNSDSEEKDVPTHAAPNQAVPNQVVPNLIPNLVRNQDLKQLLAKVGKPAIVIHSEPGHDLYQIHGSVTALRREPGVWPALAGLLGREILRRSQAESRASESAEICAAALVEATLGRYMIEMRTNINNALTTVLGNAELMAHEPGLPATVQAQADAIRSMALRLHEVFQRFSSIEKELSVAAREPARKAAHAAAGCCC
jgi:hypothetical protein